MLGVVCFVFADKISVSAGVMKRMNALSQREVYGPLFNNQCNFLGKVQFQDQLPLSQE